MCVWGESGPQQCSVWWSVVSTVSPARAGPFCCSSSSHPPSKTWMLCSLSISDLHLVLPMCETHTHQIPPFCPVNDNKADWTWLNWCVLVVSRSSGSRQPSHEHEEAADRPLPRRGRRLFTGADISRRPACDADVLPSIITAQL